MAHVTRYRECRLLDSVNGGCRSWNPCSHIRVVPKRFELKNISEGVNSHPSERSPPITACGMGRRDVHLASSSPVPKVGSGVAVIALRAKSRESSSRLKVLSVLENTDQMYAL
ncbi:hypothetical protein M758_4G153700 [Ceratodon purpureus]|nr:hypothetical protein M758_4G153700 [Ceratodon purpureus]